MNRLFPILASLAFLAAAAGLYTFFAIETTRAAAAAAAAAAQGAAAGTETLYRQSVSGLLHETSAERASLAAFVVADQDVPALLEEIENVAARERVSETVGSVSVLPSSWKYHENLEIKLSARGSLPALAAFSTDLESLPQASRLSSVSFQASENRSWLGAFTVDFVKEASAASSTAPLSPQTP